MIFFTKNLGGGAERMQPNSYCEAGQQDLQKSSDKFPIDFYDIQKIGEGVKKHVYFTVRLTVRFRPYPNFRQKLGRFFWRNRRFKIQISFSVSNSPSVKNIWSKSSISSDRYFAGWGNQRGGQSWAECAPGWPCKSLTLELPPHWSHCPCCCCLLLLLLHGDNTVVIWLGKTSVKKVFIRALSKIEGV